MPGLMLLGADHRAAPPDIRKRMAVSRGELGHVLGQLSGSTHIREVFLFSTSHRTEVYLRGLSSALDDIRRFWQERAGAPVERLEPSLYEKRDGAAVYHLFALGAGLDTTAPGESQVLGQIRKGFAAAKEAGAIGAYLDALVSRTLKLARRTRREIGSDPEPARVGKAEEMLRQEAERYILWARSHRAAPLISALKQRAEEIRQGELQKMEAKLRHLSPEEREALESLTRSLVNKLLHPSTKALKEAAGQGAASDYLQAAAELFDLGEP